MPQREGVEGCASLHRAAFKGALVERNNAAILEKKWAERFFHLVCKVAQSLQKQV